MKRTLVDRVANIDTDNVATIRNWLGHAVDLVDDIDQTYDLLATALKDPGGHDHAKILVASVARKHLTLGMMSLLRAYSSPMARETRAAVEAAGIAYAIQNNPTIFAAFKEDGSQAAREKARRALTTPNLFPDTVPEMQHLKRFYRLASTMSHTNRISMFQHITRVGDEVAEFTYQEIKDPKEATKYYLWMCRAHLRIMNATKVIFGNGFNFDEFLSQARYVRGRVDRFLQSYQGELLN